MNSDDQKTASPPLTTFRRIDNFVRGLANGLTFGGADTIAAAANTVFRDRGGKAEETIAGAFKRNLAAEHAQTARADREGGYEGQKVGALALGVGMFRLLGGFRHAASGIRFEELMANAGKIIGRRSPVEIALESQHSVTRAMAHVMKDPVAGHPAAAVAAMSALANEKKRAAEVSPTARDKPVPRRDFDPSGLK